MLETRIWLGIWLECVFECFPQCVQARKLAKRWVGRKDEDTIPMAAVPSSVMELLASVGSVGIEEREEFVEFPLERMLPRDLGAGGTADVKPGSMGNLPLRLRGGEST